MIKLLEIDFDIRGLHRLSLSMPFHLLPHRQSVSRVFLAWLISVCLISRMLAAVPLPPLGCCAVASAERQVVNADQSVIILWDQERKTQHFIRRANFKTDATDIGFLVPSPSRPQLEEAGDAAFGMLDRITAPSVIGGGGFPLGCAAAAPSAPLYRNVEVIEEKRVAGFDATVLTARSGEDLVRWLKDHGYHYSPAVAEWVKPYLGGQWHITALKVAGGKNASPQADVKAAALRMSFRTDRPLFPYREPDSAASSQRLGAKKRLLRIYLIAETQYEGKIDGSKSWSGKTLWSGEINDHRLQLLDALRLPKSSGPKSWWLTKIEDHWPYRKTAGDVYFSPVKKATSFQASANTHAEMDATGILMVSIFSFVLFVRKNKKRAS